jgi:hypothetical protein
MLAIEPIHHILNKATTQGLLRTLRGRAPRDRIYLPVDYADVIVATVRDDIKFLASTIGSFSEVTGVRISASKTPKNPFRPYMDDIFPVFAR